MARADLLVNLIKYGASGNKHMFKKVVEAIIAEERSKSHNVLADKMDRAIQVLPEESSSNGITISNNRIENFLIEISPQRNLNDLVLHKSNIEI